MHQGSLGQFSSNQLSRGKFIFEMIPANPTDEELKNGFKIKATRVSGPDDLPYIIEINQSGFTTEIFP
jgi:hypothetical protein